MREKLDQFDQQYREVLGEGIGGDDALGSSYPAYAGVVGSPFSHQPLAGQITLGVTGTFYQGSTYQESSNGFWLKPHPDNADTVWYGNTGSGQQFPLDVGETIWTPSRNIQEVWFYAESAGDIICWAKG